MCCTTNKLHIFNPTEKESDNIRHQFYSMGEPYRNLIKHFPIFDRVIKELPDTKNVGRVVDPLREVLADALCKARGIPYGSISL